MYRGTSLRVEVVHGHARYSVVDGQSVDIIHHGDEVTVEPDKTLELAIPRLHPRPAPRPGAARPPGPPPGAAPRRADRLTHEALGRRQHMPQKLNVADLKL